MYSCKNCKMETSRKRVALEDNKVVSQRPTGNLTIISPPSRFLRKGVTMQSVSASRVLGLKAYATAPSLLTSFF